MPAKFQKTQLESGITLVAEYHDHVKSVSIGVWVKVGSGHEARTQSGISHFIEHMVFKGTQKRSAIEIATALESVGGELNAFTDREYTCFHATVLKEHVSKAFDVLSDLILGPTFDKQEIEREKRVLLREMSMVEETPDEWIQDLFFLTVWKGEPLGQKVLGSHKTLKRLSRAHLVKFFGDHYRPENIVVSVAGNIEFDVVKSLCSQFFEFKPAQKSFLLRKEVSKFKPRKKSVLMDVEQTHLMVGFESVGIRDPLRFQALILSFFLGGGMSSRLFQEIREKAALAYTVECDYVPFTDTGLFLIYLATSSTSIPKCIAILAREIDRLKRVALTQEELELVKGQLKGSILLASDFMENRQESIGRNEIVFGRYVPVEEILTEIDQASSASIHELANVMFTVEKQAVVTLGKQKFKAKRLTVL